MDNTSTPDNDIIQNDADNTDTTRNPEEPQSDSAPKEPQSDSAPEDDEYTEDEEDAEDYRSEIDEDRPHVTLITDGDRTFHIVGTAHVSEKSRLEVKKLIEDLHPDTVCVELCQERYDSFYDTERWKKLNIFDVIKKGKVLYLLANLAISAYQRKMGATLGVKPGAELIGAAEVAKQNNAEVVLIDRNINITLKRVWGNLGFWTKCQLMAAIVASMFDGEEKSKDETSKEIENLKNDMNLSGMMEEFAKEMPQVHLPLIDERDRYLVSKMRECEGKNVVAVVGAGHVPGMKRYYREEIDRTELEKLPKPGILWPCIKWGFPLIVIGGIAYGFYSRGFDTLQEMLIAWIIPNSVLCFLAAIIALAHPLTILAAIIVSPLTSTTPIIGAGLVLGLLEAWLRKPSVADCEDLPNVHGWKGFYKNSFTHILIVYVLTTLGSSAGAWVSIGWIVKILGIDG